MISVMGNLAQNIVLTGRQLEVMELMSKGFSNSEIANSLGITHNTVKIHVTKIFERLKVSNRAEASALFGRINSENSPEQKAQQQTTSVLKPRIHVTLYSSNETGKIEPRWIKKFSKYVGAWELINLHVPVLNDDNMPRANSHSDYIVEFEKQQDEGITEFNWYIKYYDQDRNTFREVRSFERVQSELSTSTLIDIATLIYKELIKDVSQFSSISDPVLQAGIDFCGALDAYFQQEPSLLPKVLETCEQITRAQPEWPIPHALKALTLYRMVVVSQVDASPEIFAAISTLAQKAYALDVKSAWTHTAFSFYCIINKNLDLAEKHLESALVLNPSFYPASQMLVQVYSFLDKFDEALSLLDRWLKNHSDTQTITNIYESMAIVKYCSNDLEGAKVACESALIYTGSSKPPMLMLLTSIAERLGDQKALLECLEAVKSLSSKEHQLDKLVMYAKSVVPEKHFEIFISSLGRAGLKF